MAEHEQELSATQYQTAHMEVAVIRYHATIANAAGSVIGNASAEDDHGAFLAAIALCGTACEVAASYAFRRFVEPKPSLSRKAHESAKSAVKDLLDSNASVNLQPPTQRALWHALTGDNLVRTWSDWSAYPPFIKLRNKVIHSGRVDSGRTRPQRDTAENALRVTRSLHAHIAHVMQREGLAEWA